MPSSNGTLLREVDCFVLSFLVNICEISTVGWLIFDKYL